MRYPKTMPPTNPPVSLLLLVADAARRQRNAAALCATRRQLEMLRVDDRHTHCDARPAAVLFAASADDF